MSAWRKGGIIAVEERRRIELFEQLVPLLGEEAAATMLELLPPPGADVATKDDVARLEAAIGRLETRFDALETRFGRLESRFGGLETRLDGLETRFDGLESRFGSLEARFDGLENRVGGLVTKEEFDQALSHYATKADLHRELRLIFTAQTVALASILGAAAAFFG